MDGRELFSRHLVDRFRENGMEEAIEAERQEFASDLEFEEVKE